MSYNVYYFPIINDSIWNVTVPVSIALNKCTAWLNSWIHLILNSMVYQVDSLINSFLTKLHLIQYLISYHVEYITFSSVSRHVSYWDYANVIDLRIWDQMYKVTINWALHSYYVLQLNGVVPQVHPLKIYNHSRATHSRSKESLTPHGLRCT